MVSINDRAEGCLVGAAIGDALGMPLEFMSKSQHALLYKGELRDFVRAMPGHPCAHLQPGQYTDDTQQLMLLAESLVANAGVSLEDLGGRIAQWGNRCMTEKLYDRWAGGTSLSSAGRLAKGADPRTAGSEDSTSCGSVMRVAPVGVLYAGDTDMAAREGALSSVVTHRSRACQDGSAFVAAMISQLMMGCDAMAAVDKALGYVSDPELRTAITNARELRSQSPRITQETLGMGGSVHDTVSYAVYSFLHSPQDAERTIITSANSVPGDTDSIACIAGAFAGSHSGYESLPTRWKASLESIEHLRTLGRKLIEVGNGRHSP